MFDNLVDHALKNVWCAPRQDQQMIVRPAKLTGYGGAWNTAQVLWRRLALPIAGVRFHVYQIGQLHPGLMGLFAAGAGWTKLSTACNAENLIADLYNADGIQFPRGMAWYMVTPDNDLIFALQVTDLIPIDFNTEALFIRLYSNAFFDSNEGAEGGRRIEVEGGVVGSTEDILALQGKYNTAAAKPGKAYAFVNGYLVDAIDLINVKIGDVAEYVYDPSVYKVVDFPIAELDSFVSSLDNKHKYLLHYPGSSPRGIDFHDDIDVFIVKPGTGNRFQGIYYHRNQPDAVRMVTHKDYAVPVAYVTGYTDTQASWTDLNALRIRLHIRKAGFARALTFEKNRIHELYKLPDAEIVKAMVGLDATVSNWQAANLEASTYVALMRTDGNQVTRSLVEDAYGYNAVSKILADTPKATQLSSGHQVAPVPPGLISHATAYEYDSAGHLLGWYAQNHGYEYTAVNSATRLVEMITGLTATRLDETYGSKIVLLDPTADYRMYVCRIVNNLPNNEWEDVTGSGMYGINGNKLTWLTNTSEYYTLVRSNRINLGYDLSLQPSDGLYEFSLSHDQYRNGVLSPWVMQIPMGELDLFLNGKALIEGLDYFVQFPKIVITNKEYLLNPATQAQQVTVRMSGFCRTDLSREANNDVGFVKYGLLSNNNRFDLRDDKVLRIVVDGALYARDELQFSETDAGVTVPDARNGAPYLIRDIVVPLRGEAMDSTYPARTIAQATDQRVADYLSLKIPEQSFASPNVIEARYQVVSPFCSKLLHDLASGDLNPPKLYQHYNDNDIRTICAPYEYLLAFDPTQEAIAPDPNYVIVLPHAKTSLSVSLFHYKFMLRVIQLYLRGQVNLSGLVQLTT